MKKTLLSLSAFLLASGAIAQNKEVVNKMQVDPSFERAALAPESGWLNWGFTIDQLNGNTQETSLLTIAQDSLLIMGQFNDGSTARPAFHAAAIMVDPSNELYEFLDASNAYTADSLNVPFGYRRGSEVASSTVDTMIIEVIKHVSGDEFDYDFTDFGQTTLQDITYNHTANTVTASKLHTTIKMPLTEADTTTEDGTLIGLTNMGIDLGAINIAAGDRVGFSVKIKLGADYGYTKTDSIVDYSRFWILTTEENGSETEPTNWESFNASYVLHKSVLTNSSTQDWNGFYHPIFAFPTAYFENHDFSVRVTTENLGLVELNDMEIEVSPNPSTGLVTITSSEELNDANLQMINLLGQKVSSNTISGKNIVLDYSELNKGIYMMNFDVDGQSVTKKIILK